MKGYKIVVYGKVQKVWFRKYTQEKAIELNLLGYVMNQEDGSVFLEVFGNEENLNRLVLWLETEGSPLSKVDSIQVEKLTDSSLIYSSFTIKR